VFLASEPLQKFLFVTILKKALTLISPLKKIQLKNQERKSRKINFDDYFVEKVQQVSFIFLFFLFCLRPGPFNLCSEIFLCCPNSIENFGGY
jgi:hypothetical protein